MTLSYFVITQGTGIGLFDEKMVNQIYDNCRTIRKRGKYQRENQKDD